MYEIEITKNFQRKYRKLISKNQSLKNKISKTITNLAENPKNPILKTHKVTTKVHGEVFSSSVTGDIRIIWLISDDKKITILLVDIGGHSGFDRVYD